MELPMVNVAASAPSVEEEASAWIFRCRTHDPRQHRWMIEYLTRELGHTRVAILRTPGLMAGEHLDLWKRYIEDAKTVGARLVAEVEYDPASTPLDTVLDALKLVEPEAVLAWADVRVSATIVQAIRHRGMAAVFGGSDQIVCPEFLELAGPDAGAVIAPHPCPHRHSREAAADFVEVYTRQNSSAREKRPPKAEAYRTYDAARHLLLAISLAGLDGASIREVLARMGQPVLAVLEEDNWTLLTRPSGD
jgi:ABC-type branched-subunit amino acid transport system substrate-binding protein